MKKFIVLAHFFIFLFFSGCSLERSPTNNIRLCEVTHSLFYAPQYVAINEGFFKEQGIDLQLTNGGGSDKVMSALLSDNVDIGLAGLESNIYVYREGKKDYPMVFCQLTKRDGSFLLSRENISDFSWENLKGKAIIPGRRGSIPYMTLLYVLNEKGIDPKNDVTLNDSIQFDLMSGAFSSGNADFVTAFEPIAYQLEKKQKGFIVASIGNEIGEIPYTGYTAKQSYIQNNKELVIGFAKAIFRGQKWVSEHSAKQIANSITKQFPNIDLEDLSSAIQNYKDIDVWKTSPEMEEDFNKFQDILINASELDNKVPFEKIFNTEISKVAK